MSWRIAADAREIFVDLVAVSPDGKVCHFVRTLNRKDQLTAGLTEALNLLPAEAQESVKSGNAKLWMTSDFEKVSLRELWGSNSALVATEGFESLLEVGNHQRTHTFGLHATKPPALISKDFSFGVTERTRSDGSVETPLDQKETDFILSKMELSEVKSVAICFLHGKKNPTNEKELANKLREKGFKVFCSHEEEGNELTRAQKVTVKAFLAPGLGELNERILKMGFSKDAVFLKNQRPPLKQQAPQNTLFVEFLEDRISVQYKNLSRDLEISPLSTVELDSGGLIHIGPTKIDAEPGPVAMGKGLNLTAFDLFVLKTKLTAPDIPRMKLDHTKVLRQISPLAQNLRMDPESFAERGIGLFQECIGLEVEEILGGETPAFLVVGGWLAPSFGPALARRIGVRKICIPDHCSWLSPLQLLEVELGKDVEFKKAGLIAGSLPGALGEGEIYDL